MQYLRVLASVLLGYVLTYGAALAEDLTWVPVAVGDTMPPAIGSWSNYSTRFTSLAVSADNSLQLLAGSDGSIYSRTKSGSWHQEAKPGDSPGLNGVAISASGEAAVAVGHEGVVLSRNQNGLWTTALMPTQGLELNAVSISADGKAVVAVGRKDVGEGHFSGFIAERSRNGVWSELIMGQAADSSEGLDGVAMTGDGADAWAIGSVDQPTGTAPLLIARGRDSNWRSQTIPPQISGLADIAASFDGKSVFAAGTMQGGENNESGEKKEKGVILRRLADGTWRPEFQPDDAGTFSSVAVSPDGKAALAASEQNDLLNWDGNDNWSFQHLDALPFPLQGEAFSTRSRLLLGASSTVLEASSSGPWRQTMPQEGHGIPEGATAATTDGHLIFAISNRGQLLRRSDDGSWIIQTSQPTKNRLRDISVSSQTGILYAADNHAIFRRNNEGQWTKEYGSSDDGIDFQNIATSASGDLALVSGFGASADDWNITILGHSKTGNWHEEKVEKWNSMGSIGAIAISWNGDEAFAAGPKGFILHRDLNGKWTNESLPFEAEVKRIVILPDESATLAIASSGTFTMGRGDILLRRNVQGEWALVPLDRGLGHRLYGLAASPDGKTLLLTTSLTTVLRSTDQGRTWLKDDFPFVQDQYVKESNPLILANGSEMLFGKNGTFFERKSLRTGSAATNVAFKTTGHSLSFFWRYGPGLLPTCVSAFAWIDSEEKRFALPAPVRVADQPEYRVEWMPENFSQNFGLDTRFHYTVKCRDQGLNATWLQSFRAPSEAQMLQIPRSYRERAVHWFASQGYSVKVKVIFGISIAVLLLMWLGLLTTLLLLSPKTLVNLHEVMPATVSPDEDAPWLRKFVIDRAASSAQAALQALFIFATTRRALNAWAENSAESAREALCSRPSVRERLIALDLPVGMSKPGVDGEVTWASPWEPAMDLLRGRSSIILITGPGGGGKTTVALELARRGLDQAITYRETIIPLLIDFDLAAFELERDRFPLTIAGLLRTALNSPRPISASLTKALLRAGTVVLIVDGYSERSPEMQRAFSPSKSGFLPRRMIITSRVGDLIGASATIDIKGIPAMALPDFMNRFLRAFLIESPSAMPQETDILIASATLQRMLQSKPATALLATMWALETFAHPQSGEAVTGNIADLFDRYVRRLLLPTAGANEEVLDRLREDAAAIAEIELGERFQPRLVSSSACIKALRLLNPNGVGERFAALINSRLLEMPSAGSEAVRIAPDPVAEHLAARRIRERLGSDEEAWVRLINSLPDDEAPLGFAYSLERCATNTLYGSLVAQRTIELLKAWLEKALPE